jgi:hypothetical protein
LYETALLELNMYVAKGYDYDAEVVDLCKWIICNVWGPTE